MTTGQDPLGSNTGVGDQWVGGSLDGAGWDHSLGVVWEKALKARDSVGEPAPHKLSLLERSRGPECRASVGSYLGCRPRIPASRGGQRSGPAMASQTDATGFAACSQVTPSSGTRWHPQRITLKGVSPPIISYSSTPRGHRFSSLMSWCTILPSTVAVAHGVQQRREETAHQGPLSSAALSDEVKEVWACSGS